MNERGFRWALNGRLSLLTMGGKSPALRPLFNGALAALQSIGFIVIILLYCFYCDYCDYCDYCILLTGSRWSGSSWPCLGRETCCNCETSWRSGRPVPSCHAKGVAFLHSEDLCCWRWWLWCCDGTGWIGRAWRCVIAVMPCTGLHNKYLSKLQFRVSQ